MTTLAEAKAAIYSRFINNWSESLLPLYTLDNEEFTPPGPSTDGTRQPWLRLTVRHTGRNQTTMGRKGNRKFNRTGSVFIQVFTATDEGTFEADRLAELAANIFEGEKLKGTSVWFKDVIIKELGVTDSWYGILVEAKFEYQELK